VKTGGEGSLDIPENALDQREVRLAGIMHEQAHLLNDIGQIGLCQSEVLEGTGKTLVLGGVSHQGACGGGQLVLRVHWRGSGMAFRHANSLEKVNGILTLRQEQPRVVAHHGDAKEVVKVSKIRHGELGMEACHDEL
jgi:hypothetical protein